MESVTFPPVKVDFLNPEKVPSQDRELTQSLVTMVMTAYQRDKSIHQDWNDARLWDDFENQRTGPPIRNVRVKLLEFEEPDAVKGLTQRTRPDVFNSTKAFEELLMSPQVRGNIDSESGERQINLVASAMRDYMFMYSVLPGIHLVRFIEGKPIRAIPMTPEGAYTDWRELTDSERERLTLLLNHVTQKINGLIRSDNRQEADKKLFETGQGLDVISESGVITPHSCDEAIRRYLEQIKEYNYEHGFPNNVTSLGIAK